MHGHLPIEVTKNTEIRRSSRLVGLTPPFEEGGKLTLDDLSKYRPRWTTPVGCHLGEFEVFSAGLPGLGGVNLVEALNLIDISKSYRPDIDYTRDPKLLYWLIKTPGQTRY